MNERWRVALAGLVAALAIPFLIVDSPAPAEGVETNGASNGASSEVATVPSSTTSIPAESDDVDSAVAPEIIVVNAALSPDVLRLSDQAATWGVARDQAIADGLVETNQVLPPSNTNLSLLPVVPSAPAENSDSESPAEPDPIDETPTEEPEEPVAETPTEEPVEEPVDETPTEEPVEEPVDETPTEEPVEEPEVPEVPDDIEEPEEPEAPAPPAQVNGRVPPPAGGPTGAQWDAVRRCESTHNYRAISPSGLYRGAYQFSQQTWDWVAGIHQPHLVGIDPIDAEPAWQDVMAYTLYAMRGWDQWPVCGKNLL